MNVCKKASGLTQDSCCSPAVKSYRSIFFFFFKVNFFKLQKIFSLYLLISNYLQGYIVKCKMRTEQAIVNALLAGGRGFDKGNIYSYPERLSLKGRRKG